MANRIGTINQFENLSPPWLLTSLDQYFAFITSGFTDSSLGWVNGVPLDTGTANNYVISALPFGVPSNYQDGMMLVWIPNNTNTGQSNITINPLGSTSILNPAGIVLQGGELAANQAVAMVYKSATPSGFRIIGPCPLGIQKVLSSSTSATIECAGYSSINAEVVFASGGASQTVSLAHLAAGVPVNLWIANGVASTITVFVNGTNPTGTPFSSVTGVITSNSTSVLLNIQGSVFGVAQSQVFTGGAINSANAVFSI